MHEGKKLSDFCYEHDDGDFYIILTLYGWAIVNMVGKGECYTYSIMEH